MNLCIIELASNLTLKHLRVAVSLSLLHATRVQSGEDEHERVDDAECDQHATDHEQRLGEDFNLIHRGVSASIYIECEGTYDDGAARGGGHDGAVGVVRGFVPAAAVVLALQTFSNVARQLVPSCKSTASVRSGLSS